MGLTEYGKAVRRMRIDCNQTLASMAVKLEISTAFLSSIETGRQKVPKAIVLKTTDFFKELGLEPKNLHILADVSNGSIAISGLELKHQMLVSRFARSSLDSEQLEKMAKLLETSITNGD